MNEVPGQFCHRIIEGSSSISFTLPLLPNLQILGLNIFVVYENSDNVHANSNSDSDNDSKECPIIIKIRNKSKSLKWMYGSQFYGIPGKGLKWIYSPSFFGIPGEGESMTWLSHWSMLENQLEGGDEVTVSVFLRRPDLFKIKECGIQIVQEEKEENTSSLVFTHPDLVNYMDHCYVHRTCTATALNSFFKDSDEETGVHFI